MSVPNPRLRRPHWFFRITAISIGILGLVALVYLEGVRAAHKERIREAGEHRDATVLETRSMESLKRQRVEYLRRRMFLEWPGRSAQQAAKWFSSLSHRIPSAASVQGLDVNVGPQSLHFRISGTFDAPSPVHAVRLNQLLAAIRAMEDVLSVSLQEPENPPAGDRRFIIRGELELW